MEIKDMLSKFQDRLQQAEAAQAEYLDEFELADLQYESNIIIDERGNIKYNAPIEKSLTETYTGKFSGKLSYDIVPIQQASVDELQPAKYILEHFLDDDNQKYSFFEEKKNFLFDKSKYGTGVFYTGITLDKEIIPKLPKDAKSIFTNKYEEEVLERWSFVPRNIPIRNILFDHTALKHNNFNRVKYAIMIERMRPEELKERYGDIKEFKGLDNVEIGDGATADYSERPLQNEEAVIYYYFDQQTKDYWVIANKTTLLFAGKYFYRNGKLPFVVAQHYTRTNSLYGEGIPKRVRAMKGYKNIAMQSMLDKMMMSSGINLGIGNNQSVESDLYTASGEVNIWNFTSSMDQVKQFNLDGNVNTQMSILNLLDSMITQDSGVDINAGFSPITNTLGQQEILEENKQQRVASVDENYHIALDKALTDCLWNIRQYAPTLLKKTEEVDGKTVTEYPVIRIPGKRVEKKKGKMNFVDDYGEYGFFEFDEKVLKHDMTVKIETLSTQGANKSLERNKIQGLIEAMAILSKFNPEMVMEHLNIGDMVHWINNAYGVDQDKLNAKTKKDKIREKNQQLLKEFTDAIGLNPVTGQEMPMQGEAQPFQGDAPHPDPNPLMNPNERTELQEGSDDMNALLGRINV